MDRSIECCAFFLRSQLQEMLLEEPQNLDDLHRLVQRLLDLHDQLKDSVSLCEDIANDNYLYE